MTSFSEKARGIVLACCLALLSTISIGATASFPTAETYSDITISAALDEGAWILASPNAEIYAATGTQAMAVANGTSAPYALHAATALAQADVLAGPSLYAADRSDASSLVATFHTALATRATSFAREALFARSAAVGIAGIEGVRVAVSSDKGANLMLSWDVASLGLQATSNAAFSLIRQTVTVFQAPSQTREGSNAVATLYNPVSATQGFLLINDNGRTLSLGADLSSRNPVPLTILVPLASPAGDEAGAPRELELGIKVTQFEYSAEAPPVATRRVAEQVGGTSAGARMRWDAAHGTLSFDALPVSILSDGPAEIVADRFSGDPLANASFEIDPLTFVGESGRTRYFSGNQIRLVGADGTVLFAASLPTVAFDDSPAEIGSFDLFAPILNILHEDLERSPWLRIFDARKTLDSPFLPEFFIGFDLPSSSDGSPSEADFDPWASDFQAEPKAVLSFAGPVPDASKPAPVPAPGTLTVLCAGLAVLAVSLRLKRREVRCAPG